MTQNNGELSQISSSGKENSKPHEYKHRNILFVLDSFNGGGVQKVIYEIAKGLHEQGHAISIAVLENKGALKQAFEAEFTIHDLNIRFSLWDSIVFGAKIIFQYIKTFGLNRYNYGLVKSIIYGPQLIILTDDMPYTEIISSTRLCDVVLSVAAESINLKAKLISCIHTHLSYVIKSKSKTLHEKERTTSILKKVYLKRDGIVCVSKGVRDDLVNYFNIKPKYIEVIYNSAYPNELENKISEDMTEAWLQQQDIPTYVNIGRISHQKNQELLLEALSIANNTRSIRMIIIGGVDKSKHQNILSQLEQKTIDLGLKDKVKFLGEVSNPLKFLSRSRGLVLSSSYEGFGIVLIEALACGVPVISTDCPSGPGEILDNGKYGFLVAPDDAEGLASAMVSCLDTVVDASKLRQRAAEFSTEKSVRAYAAFLNRF